MNKQFGQYLTVEQLHSGPFGTVYKAKHAKARGEFAVKHFNPDPVLASRDQIKQALIDFVERAQLQQQIAAGKCRNWVVVQELVGGEGGYCVFAYCAFSVRRLIQTRAQLTGADLHSIIDGILAGLSELRRVANRAHGNLKPENVLLSRRRSGVGFDVCLTDPAPSWQLGSGTDAERRDLRSVGQIIHDLVVPDPRSVHHAGPSPRWETLGLAGEGWRSLCNDLIAEDADRLLANLDELKKRVAQFGGHYKGQRFSPGKIAAAATVVIVAGGVVAAWPFVKKSDFWTRRRSNVVDARSKTTGDNRLDPRTVATQPATAPVDVATQPAQTQPSRQETVVATSTTQPMVVERPATAPVVNDPATHPVVVDADKKKMPQTQPDLTPLRNNLTDAAAKVRELLDQGYSTIPEPGTTESPVVFAIGRYNKAKEQLPGDDVRQISGDLDKRLGEAAAIAQARELPALLEAITTSEHVEVAMLGWRRLGEMAWPANGDPLPGIAEAASHLSSLVNRISDSERRAGLTQEITPSLPRLWQQQANVAQTTGAIDSAIVIAPRFNVQPGQVDALKAARPQRRQAEFRDTIEKLRSANVIGAQGYTAAKSMIDSERPLMEPIPGRRLLLAELERANPGSTTARQNAEATFPDLIVYRWLMMARAAAATLDAKERSGEFAAVAMAMAQADYASDAADTVMGMDVSPAKAAALARLAVIESKRGDAQSANNLLMQAGAMASQFSNFNDRISVYIDVAKGEAESGAKPAATQTLGQAKAVAARINDADAKIKAMEMICAAQSAIGDARAALVTASSFSTNAEKAAIARRLIVCAQADNGDIGGARAGLLNIRTPADKSVAQQHIAAAQAKAGDYSGATATAGAIESRFEKCLAFLSIADRQLAAGNRVGAQISLESAILNLAPGPDSNKWGLYIHAARLQAELGKIPAAQSNVTAIQSLPDRAAAYAAIAEAQAAAGDAAGASETLQLAGRTIAGAGEPHRAPALGRLVQSDVKLGLWPAALQTLEVAKNLLGANANSQDDDAEDTELVRAQAVAGDWDRLDTLAPAARDPSTKIRTLTAAASALASMQSSRAIR